MHTQQEFPSLELVQAVYDLDTVSNWLILTPGNLFVARHNNMLNLAYLAVCTHTHTHTHPQHVHSVSLSISSPEDFVYPLVYTINPVLNRVEPLQLHSDMSTRQGIDY